MDRTGPAGWDRASDESDEENEVLTIRRRPTHERLRGQLAQATAAVPPVPAVPRTHIAADVSDEHGGDDPLGATGGNVTRPRLLTQSSTVTGPGAPSLATSGSQDGPINDSTSLQGMRSYEPLFASDPRSAFFASASTPSRSKRGSDGRVRTPTAERRSSEGAGRGAASGKARISFEAVRKRLSGGGSSPKPSARPVIGRVDSRNERFQQLGSDDDDHCASASPPTASSGPAKDPSRATGQQAGRRSGVTRSPAGDNSPQTAWFVTPPLPPPRRSTLSARYDSPDSEGDISGGLRRRPRQMWESHRGNNRFFFEGRLMTSGDHPAPALSSFVIAVAVPVVFGVLEGPWIVHHGGGWPVVGAFVYLCLIMLASMIKTSLIDPGIVPRGLDPDPPTEWWGEDEDQAAGPGMEVYQKRWIKIRGRNVPLKYCETCNTYRPPRAAHCRICDNCVMNLDHHCTFLNTCIGRRNYQSFLAFIVVATFNLLCVIGYSVAVLVVRYRTVRSHPRFLTADVDGRAASEGVGALVVGLAALVLLMPVGGLACFHIMLTARNQTTIDSLRPRYYRREESLVNDLGSWRANCFAVLCRPTGFESAIDFTQRRSEEMRSSFELVERPRSMSPLEAGTPAY